MATVHQSDGRAVQADEPHVHRVPELVIYSHSRLLYWWPVWLVGYAMAILTFLHGENVTIGGVDYLMHPSKNIGVIFTMTFMLVILFSNISVRGLLSLVVILGVLFLTVLFAWLGWWDDIVSWFPYIGVHMNVGFYVFFSTALFIVWLLAFFIFDRMTYWRVRPGQMTMERVIGGGEKSYDTHGMVFEKHLEDFFRHWVLGVGAGDLHISTTGARAEDIYIPNVAFVDRKVAAIQRLIAVKPDTLT
jgi:hypothetical protein